MYLLKPKESKEKWFEKKKFSVRNGMVVTRLQKSKKDKFGKFVNGNDNIRDKSFIHITVVYK